MRPCLVCRRRTANPRFCSKRCAAIRNNHLFPKRRPQGKCRSCHKPVPTRRRLCDICGSRFGRKGTVGEGKEGLSRSFIDRRTALRSLGLALWWGEGGKNRDSVTITNSDPDVILLAIKWLREIHHVPAKKLRLRLHIHSTAPIDAIIAFWRRLTGIPGRQFYRPYIIPKQPKEGFHKLPFGVCCVAVYDVKLFDSLTSELERARLLARPAVRRIRTRESIESMKARGDDAVAASGRRLTSSTSDPSAVRKLLRKIH